jgi:molecular chaperone DnaK
VATGQEQSINVTATSGLTENELKKIIDENLDDLLEKKQSTVELERSRSRVAVAIAEIEALVPAVQAALERSRFGRDAVQKAEGVLARARLALDGKDTEELARAGEALERTLQLFKGLAAAPPEGA